MMRSFLLLFGVLAAGCSWTSEGGLTDRYVSDKESTVQSAEGSWKGEAIAIRNAHGSIQVVGVPDRTSLSVRARLVAGANSQADADAAFEDTARSIKIALRDGAWVVECGEASERHGSAYPASTGCTSLVVEVPAGTAKAPIELSASTPFGGIHVEGVTPAKLTLDAPFGLVASVEPTPKAVITMTGANLVSGFCSTILSVPSDFAADQVSLTVDKVDVKFVDHEDDPRWTPGVELSGLYHATSSIPPRTASFAGSLGQAGEGASSIKLHASIGKAILGDVAIPAYDPYNECQKADPITYEADL